MRRQKGCPRPQQPQSQLQQPPQRFHHQTSDDVINLDSEPNFNFNYGPRHRKASADENYSIFLRLLEEERQRILGAHNQIQCQEEEEPQEKGAGIPPCPLPPLHFHFLEFKGLDGFDPQSCKWRLRPNSSLSHDHVSFLPHITQQQQQRHPHFHIPRTNGSSPDHASASAPYRSPSCHLPLPPNYNYNYDNIQNERAPFPPVPTYESPDDGGAGVGGRGWSPQHFKKRAGSKKGKRWKCADAQEDKMTDVETQFNLDRIKVFTETGVGHLHSFNKGKRGNNSNLLSLPPLGSLLATCGRVIQPPRFSNLNLPVNHNDNDNDNDENCYGSGWDFANAGDLNNAGECEYILDPNLNLSAAPQSQSVGKKGGKENRRWKVGKMVAEREDRCWNYGGTERRNSNESVALSWFGRRVKIGKGSNNCVRKCGGGGYATAINSSHLHLFPQDAHHGNNSASGSGSGAGGLHRNNPNQKRNSRRKNGNEVGDEVERLAGGAYALKVKPKIDSWWRPKPKRKH